MRTLAIGIATLSIVAGFLPSSADANGRFPATTHVELHPSDPDVRLVPATFGMLLTTDGGASYRWVCETALGYGGTYDPDYALASDNSIFVTSFDGLRVSRDGGCTYERVSGELGSLFPSSVEIAANGDVWASVAEPAANGLYRSTDNGMTFGRTNLDVPSALYRQLRIAPSNSNRVYISGYFIPGALPDAGVGERAAIVYRTDDAGDLWIELPVTDFGFAAEPLLDIEAVSPADADVVYARVVRAFPPNGDALYRSTDAGESWTKILETGDSITAVVARADGTTLLVGTKLDTPHVRISPDRGDTWITPGAQPQMSCASERADGTLFTCGVNWQPDCMAVGRSTDGHAWETVFQFHETVGPLECNPGTLQFDVCTVELWPGLSKQLGVGGAGCSAGPDAGPIDAAPGIDAPAAVDGGPGVSDGGGDCGCSAGLAAVLFALPFRRRRRASIARIQPRKT